MSVARYIADQRTNYRVPPTSSGALLGVSLSWFYTWLDRPPTATEQRRTDLDGAIAATTVVRKPCQVSLALSCATRVARS